MFVFLHMPKTGGNSFRSLMLDRYGADRVHDVNNRRQMCDYLENPVPYPALCGHMPYGIHRHLNLIEPCQYFVMLREPVDRAVSDYYYILQSPQHGLYEQIQRGMTLVDFAQDPELRNRQCVRLADYDLLTPKKEGHDWWLRECSPETFDQAREVLFERVKHFGVFEEFADSVYYFCDLIEHVPSRIPKVNATARRPTVDELEPEVCDAIRECNRYDVELYDLALRHFHQDAAVRDAVARTSARTGGNLVASVE